MNVHSTTCSYPVELYKLWYTLADFCQTGIFAGFSLRCCMTTQAWFMTRSYDAKEALAMGLVNTVVPVADLEAETVSWCREMLRNSPLALRLLKASLNAADDGLAGVQQLAGDATLLFYMTEEGQEGRDAYKEKRAPDFGQFPKRP